MSDVPAAILAERERQIGEEGFDAAHDASHDDGELLAVARMYYQLAIGGVLPMRTGWSPADSRDPGPRVPVGWPWADHWWKPRTARRNLERGGALCLAEIDRLRRGGRPAAHVEEQLGLIVSAYNGLVAS